LAAVQEHSRALRRTFIVGVLVALSLAAAFVYAGHRLITRPLVRGVEDLRLGRAPDPAKRQSVLRIRELYTVDTAAERLSKLLARVRLRETRLRLALEGGNHGLWDADVRSGRVETSGRIEQALGCSRGAWPGTLARWRLRVHPADRPRMTAALRAHLRGDAVFYHADYRVRTEAGGWLWISDRGQVVERDAAGRPLRAIGTHTDISARKAIEADLKRSNDDLERFAYIASHDLKEPLRMIVSYLNLLKNRYGGRLGAEADEFIDYAVSGGRRLHRMIDDLLDYARIDRTATPVPVDLRACLDEALDILRPVIESRGAAITSDPLPVVPGLPGQLTRLFVNLVSNAIKYAAADKPPVIHVGAVRQGAVWVLSVADNGVGIDPAYHERIFDVFQRLNVRDLDDYGSGIGLAICRRIVQAHGGTIAVDSRPGRGAVFTLTLPAEDRAGDPAEGAAEGDTGTALRAPAAGDGARHVGRIG
jgi:PAS domain S-box-containing protein